MGEFRFTLSARLKRLRLFFFIKKSERQTQSVFGFRAAVLEQVLDSVGFGLRDSHS